MSACCPVGEAWYRTVLTGFAKAAAIPYYRAKLARFQRQLERASEVQHTALMSKIRRCAETQFGRDHGFSKIATVEDFRRHVPVCRYEDLSPYITAVSEGQLDALFPPGEKVWAFACTTGTTGKPKLNPVTNTWLREYMRAWEVWGVKAIAEHPEMIGRKLLQLTGPGNLARSPSGLPIGMVSSIAARHQNRVLRAFYAVPQDVSDIGDSLAKYYTTLRLAIASTVGFIVAITPANLIRLAEVGEAHREQLIRDVHDGTLWTGLEIPASQRKTLEPLYRAKRPQRARILEQVIERTGSFYPKDYWPLSLISCWLGGTVGYQSRDLARYYGDTPSRDLGLVSTEGRHTIPLHDGVPQGVLAVDGSYYEFVPVEDRGSVQPHVFEGHQLTPGRDYDLLMTTSSGLYRYDIGDVVRCQDFVGQAPVLEFLHKIGQCSDMEGEKISGHQVAQAVEAASRQLGLYVDCFVAVPVRRNGYPPHYALLVEKSAIQDPSTARQFLEFVDQSLVQQNVMYAGKRNDRYIGSPQLLRLAPGTWSRFVASETQVRGTGDSQYKHPALVPDSKWLDRFQPLDTITVDAAS